MNRSRIAKEFRPLLLPALVALVAVFALEEEGIRGFAVIVLVGSIGLMAALVFGQELNQRTMVLLLAQPVGRWVLWREKLLPLGAISLVLFCTAFATQGFAKNGINVSLLGLF